MAYDVVNTKSEKPGAVTFSVGEKIVCQKEFTPDDNPTIDLGCDVAVPPGNSKLELDLKEGSAGMYTMGITYFNTVPDNSPECKVNMTTELLSESIKESEGTEIRVSIKNISDSVIPMTLAIIGLPGGLEPRHQQLKELVTKNTIDFYEIMGRDVVCYWRSFEPEEEKIFSIDVIAKVPGNYEGAASRCYLY